MVKLPWLEYVNGSAVVPKTLPTQLSVAVGAVTVTEHSPVAVLSTGNAGAVISCTVTVALHVAVLLLPSVTVNVTVLAPRFEQLNDVLLADKVTPPHTSELPLSICDAVIVAVPAALKLISMFLQDTVGTVTS